MMLDAKRTFDELIDRLAPDAQTRDEVLENRIYQQLSGAVAGSQEFTAVAKLYELDRSGRFDAIVLDTPPSRNALDFLDAPDRLTQFFEGRALRVFLPRRGWPRRSSGRSTSVVFSVLKRLTGVDLLQDLSVFFRALGGLIEGFRERAEGVKALLADPATTFLVVTSPEREPVEEAIFFRGKLRDARMPFGGLIVNRVHPLRDAGLAPDAVLAELREPLGEALAGKVARTWAEELVLAHRDAEALEHLAERTGERRPVVVPQLDGDVHDVDGLVAVHAHLFGLVGDATTPPPPAGLGQRRLLLAPRRRGGGRRPRAGRRRGGRRGRRAAAPAGGRRARRRAPPAPGRARRRRSRRARRRSRRATRSASSPRPAGAAHSAASRRGSRPEGVPSGSSSARSASSTSVSACSGPGASQAVVKRASAQASGPERGVRRVTSEQKARSSSSWTAVTRTRSSGGARSRRGRTAARRPRPVRVQASGPKAKGAPS